MDIRVTERRSRRAAVAWIAAALLLFFALSCAWFATRQQIWIDESTQLSGLTLSPAEMIRWLAGADPNRFGVPGDRMPPLGYLVDWAWWHVSQSVLALRLFHAALVVAALWLFAQVERTYVAGSWFAIGLLFIAMSPKTIQFAVELRAYPVLFACACVQAAMFLRLVAVPDRPPPRSLGVFALVCVATSFVHFFGVVATFAYFGALLLRFVGVAPWRVIVAGGCTGLPMIALKPFVTGASALSGGTLIVGQGPAQYVVQLIAGSAYLVLPIAGILFVGGCAALLLAGVVGAGRRAIERRVEPVDYMVVVAALGVLATIVPHFVIHSFDPLKPSYSIWLLPVLALIIASGARREAGGAIWPIGGMVALALGATASTAIFLTHPDWYVHGPSREIAIADGATTPIVYIGDETYGYGYFPTVYLSHGRAPQWLARSDGLRRLPDIANAAARPFAVLAGSREIAIVDIRLRRYTDLGQCLGGRCPPFDRSPILDAMIGGGGWREGPSTRTFGHYDATVTRLYATGR